MNFSALVHCEVFRTRPSSIRKHFESVPGDFAVKCDKLGRPEAEWHRRVQAAGGFETCSGLMALASMVWLGIVRKRVSVTSWGHVAEPVNHEP